MRRKAVVVRGRRQSHCVDWRIGSGSAVLVQEWDIASGWLELRAPAALPQQLALLRGD